MQSSFALFQVILMLHRCIRNAVGFSTKQYYGQQFLFNTARQTQTTSLSSHQKHIYYAKSVNFSIYSHSNKEAHRNEECLHLKLSVEEIEASLGPNRKISRKPFSWQELKDIVKNGDPTQHSRSLQVQEAYIFHVKEVKQEWKSMNDFILHSKFGFDSDILEDGKKCARPTLEEVRAEGRIETRLLLNEFPYYCQEGIEHYCLWKLGGPIQAFEMDQALDDLRGMRETSGELEDVLYWVNPKHLQSIPDIDHAHFLCLRRVKNMP